MYSKAVIVLTLLLATSFGGGFLAFAYFLFDVNASQHAQGGFPMLYAQSSGGGQLSISSDLPGEREAESSSATIPIRVRRQSKHTIDSLKSLLPSTDGDVRIRVLRSLGWEYRKFDLLSSFDYALQSVELARLANSKELAASLNIFGITYRNISNYPKALECFVEALRIAITTENWREEGYAYNNMGDIYRLQGNETWAEEYVTKALNVFEAHKYLEGMGYSFARLGEIAESKKQFEKAFQYNMRAFDVRRENGDTTQMYVALIKIGRIHQIERRYQEAKQCYERALDFMKNAGAISDVAATLGRLANLHFDMNQFHEAIRLGQAGLGFAQQARAQIDIQDLSMILWRSYAALKDYQKAFDFQSLYLRTRDSITSEESIRQSAAIQIKYEIQRKQDEIDAIEASNRMVRWVLVCGLCFCAILLGILTNRYNLKKKTTAEILHQQGVLTAQAKEIEIINTQLQEQNILLEEERRVSERLLRNVLPAGIATRLMAGEKLIAERFTNVTVLFADIAGFTLLAKRIQPEEVVVLLDTVFSEFDTITEELGLEKIKTIGDCYMLVGGLPERQNDHCHRAAKAALAMLAAMQRLNTITELNIAMRIGIHTGEVVAGVIGKKKFSYDLWGDTVNTASRMESHGEAGKIHCSEAVFEALWQDFIFDEGREITVKGQGAMKTYFLQGIRYEQNDQDA